MNRLTVLLIILPAFADGVPSLLQAGPPRTDLQGDPLPEGALFRFGSVRNRHANSIENSALSQDGKHLATIANRSVIVWDVATGKPLQRFPTPDSPHFCTPGIAFSPDGNRLGCVFSTDYACVWDLTTGRMVRRFENGEQRQNALCHFASGGTELVLTQKDRAEFVDLLTGKVRRPILLGHVDLLSPDAKLFVQILEGQAVVIGDVGTGKLLSRWDVKAAHNGLETGVEFSADGRMLAVVARNEAVQVRTVPDGKVRASFPLPAEARSTASKRYPEYRAGLTADGGTLLLGTDCGVIHRWDLVSGKELPPLGKREGAIAAFHSLPDGQTLVTTGHDGLIRRWNMSNGHEINSVEGYLGRTRAACSPSGRWVAVGDALGQLDLWDITAGKRIRRLSSAGPAVTNLVFAPDGKSLAVGKATGIVQWWHVPSAHRPSILCWDDPDKRSTVRTLLFSPDGRCLLASDYSREMCLWELATGKRCWKGRYDCAAAFSPDGCRLVAALGGPHLTVLDAATGKEQSQARLNVDVSDNYFNAVDAAAFSPDGHWLAVALYDGRVEIRDGCTLTVRNQFAAVDEQLGLHWKNRLHKRHGHRVETLAFSPDGKWLASGGTDGSVRIWETATGKQALRLSGHEASVTQVAFASDSRALLSSGHDAQAYWWGARPLSTVRSRPKLDALWLDLASDEAATAYRAVWTLSDDAGSACRLLRDKITAARPVEPGHVRKRIADLDSDQFTVRERAAGELGALGRRARPPLEEALKKLPSLEARRRLERLLENLKQGPTPQEIQQMRAVQVLELVGTSEARQILLAWAAGAPGDWLTDDAQSALARLRQQDQK